MLTSVLEGGVGVGPYPELVGKRILITGLDLCAGVDVARAFAEQGCRIVLHTTAHGSEADAVLEMLAQTASELQVYSEPLMERDATVRFAQTAAKTFNGLDAVINLVPFDADAIDFDDVEEAISRQFEKTTLLTRIAANRMRLTWTEGLILNIMTCSAPRSDAELMLLSIARAMLATMTRAEAGEWAGEAIRINAIAPSLDQIDASPRLETEPDIAALAMFLASPRGRHLSGLVFDTVLAGCVAEAI